MLAPSGPQRFLSGIGHIMNRRTIAAGIGWAVVLSLAGCGGKPDSAKTAMPVGSAALAVELSQVTQAPLVRSVTVSGAVAAW